MRPIRPNPLRIKSFLRDQRLDLPITEIAMRKGEHRSPATLTRNPCGQVPFLELDDGQVIAETVAICGYLDELHPEPPMFGSDALERATTDMGLRRVESGLRVAVAGVWIHGHALTAALVTRVPPYTDFSRANALQAMCWFDTQQAGRRWLAGTRCSMADIALLTTIDFAAWIGLPVPDDPVELRGWHERTIARYA